MINIREVAKIAGVSPSTVSRVINGSDVVREDTRLKVEDAINKLGYKPNAIAQGLALSKTTTIALVVPGSNISMASQIILTALMFIGRIGPMTMFLSLLPSKQDKKRDIKYTNTNILIG